MLEPAGADGTHVTISTDLAISGRVAQFGRGALADVSTKLLDQFVDCLETDVPGRQQRTADGGPQSNSRRLRPTSDGANARTRNSAPDLSAAQDPVS